MINRVTGEVCFTSGLHIRPHCAIDLSQVKADERSQFRTQKLSLPVWKRHVLGRQTSEHGTFEVEALSMEEDRIYVVMLAHQHPFYERGTPEDAERRAYHEGVISRDLAGQKDFTWGEVVCRLESRANKDWLVIAYSWDAKVPFSEEQIILYLRGRENPGT